MAEAKISSKEVEITKIVNMDLVNLELSMDEAAFLKALLEKIGGSPDGLRGISDGISKALREAIGYRSFNSAALMQGRQNTVYFAETSKPSDIVDRILHF